MKNIWYRYKWHIPPVMVFVIAIIISLCILANDEGKITFSLSVLGTGFAIFQFWVGEINTDKRRLYDLRFLSYREITDEINKIIELFNSDLPSNKCIDCENFHSSVLSISNRILVHIDLLNALVFKDIKIKNECTNLHNSLTQIVNNTEKFRENMLQNSNSTDKNKLNLQYKWNVSMMPILKEYSNAIDDFQDMLKSYL